MKNLTEGVVEKIYVNGQVIVGHFIASENTDRRGAILFIHGWGSNQKKNIDRAKELAPLGYACLTIDLRGHGGSDGDFKTLSRADHLADVIAAYDFLAAHKRVDLENISVIGSSYGGYLAALLTGERSVQNLVMRVPANYYDENFDQPTYEIRKAPGLAGYRESDLTSEDNKALHSASLFKGNVWIIESEKDELIPHQTIENYKNAFIKAASLKYTLMHGAGHVLDEQNFLLYRKLLNEYFRSAIII